jgi:hypothetical protein
MAVRDSPPSTDPSSSPTPLPDEALDRLADRIAERVAERLRTDQDRLLDLRQLAERLQLSPRGVTGLVARGELPPGDLIGGVRRWAWDEVRKFRAVRRERKPRKGRGRYSRGGREGEPEASS